MMASFPISLLLIVAFLVLTLVVGLMGSKATTFRAYVVDNKQLSTFKLLATTVGTSFCGFLLVCKVGSIYKCEFDFSKIIMILGNFFSLWLISLIWMRMAPFMQHLSMAETIGHTYGKSFRVITALHCILLSIVIISVEINVISLFVRICLDSIYYSNISIWVTLVLIVYTILGGVRSVTNTDVLQCIIFIAIICLIAKLMFVKTDKSILEVVSLVHKQGKFTFKLSNVLLCALYCSLNISNPAIIQRVYMCSGPIQVKKVFLYSSFVFFLIMLFVGLIGLFVFSANSTLPVPEIWKYIVADMPPFLRGLVVIGVLGAAMSTVDSFLHLCSVVVSHDLMESIRGVKPISDRFQIRVAQLTSLIVGLLVMILACYENYVLFIFNGITSNVYVHGFFIAFASLLDYSITSLFILALFGFRGTSCTAFIGMVTSMLVCLVYIRLGFSMGPSSRLLCTVASTLGMLAAHYLLPQPAGKGWVGLDAQQKRLLQLTSVFKKLKKRVDIE